MCHAHVGTRAPHTKRCGKVTDYNQGCKAAHSHAVRDVTLLWPSAQLISANSL